MHTPGPWEVFICDDGGKWTGWPLSITAPSVHADCMVVRTGGQWPYRWDYSVSQAEAVGNAYLIAAAPDLLAALQLLADTVEKAFPALSKSAPITAARAAIAKASA